MKILHTADWHIGNFPGPEKDGRNLRADATGMCIPHLHDIALLKKPQMILISGDLFHQARVWADRGLHEVEVAIRALTALSDICPVVVMRGTPNHDGSEQFSMLKAHFYGDDSVHIVTEPTVLRMKGNKIADRWVNIACLPGFDRGVFRAKFPGLSKEEENMVFTEELGKIVLALRAECDPSLPSILMSHYTVPGCNTESGQTQFLTQFEPVLLPETLDAAGFDLVALGHIHRPQQISTCKNTFYSGAINAFNFNDEGQERGFWIHEFPDAPVLDVTADTPIPAVKHTFYKTPAREFLTMHFTQTDIDGINAGVLDDVAHNWWKWDNSVEGKIVRVLYTCTEDAHKAFNRSLLEKQLYADGAFWVSEISPEQVTIGTNKDELSEKTDPEKNLRLYLDEKGLPDTDVGEIVEIARPISLVGDVLGLAAALAGDIAAELFGSCGLGLFFGAVVGTMATILTDLAETLLVQDLETVIPDGCPSGVAVGNHVGIEGSADDDFHTFDASLPIGESFNHDADDFEAVGEVNLGGLALGAAHGSGVDGVALADVLGDDLGVPLVDVSVFHVASSLVVVADKTIGTVPALVSKIIVTSEELTGSLCGSSGVACRLFCDRGLGDALPVFVINPIDLHGLHPFCCLCIL